MKFGDYLKLLFEIFFQMCFRINNLHNLNIALEDVQQKIAALLKVDIITVTESAKSKEHPRGKRNGIFFSSD